MGEVGEAPIAGALLVAMEPVQGGGHGAFGSAGPAVAGPDRVAMPAAAARRSRLPSPPLPAWMPMPRPPPTPPRADDARAGAPGHDVEAAQAAEVGLLAPARPAPARLAKDRRLVVEFLLLRRETGDSSASSVFSTVGSSGGLPK